MFFLKALRVCEEGLRRCQEATETLGRLIHTWTLLVDLDGLTMRHLWRPGIQVIRIFIYNSAICAM